MNASTGHNRLKDERSAYLLQHADNPIHWYSYGPEALLAAKELDKPIFLSIGYSSCHWCHVMAHESFESPQVADFINQHFISIKIDREEFPDIDNYYQKAAMHFNSRGGWPLNAFCTPDLKPFFVGTYFPFPARDGMTGFLDLSKKVHEAFSKTRAQVEKEAEDLTKLTNSPVTTNNKIDLEGHFPTPNSVMKALDQYKDKENGSFGGSPKFPLFAFSEWAVEQMLEGMMDQDEGKFILESIEKMMMGGIFDQARGGIHRYSVDEKWQVPHFEKMLYDQSGLLRVLSKASVMYPAPTLFDGILQTLDYIETEMMSEKGYFFSAQDADSEGIEGLYFTFQENEFAEAVAEYAPQLSEEIDTIKKWFSVSTSGNFEHDLNVLALNPAFKEQLYTPENWEKVRKVRQAIIEVRKMRIPPQTDNKGVAAWNFMMISALADVIQYCRIDVIRNQAWAILNKCIEPILKEFIELDDGFSGSEGILSKNHIKHTTTLPFRHPYLEDYVFFAESQFRIYELTGNPIFKGNALKTLGHIKDEFMKDGVLYTRSTKYNDSEPYANIAASLYDQSYRSPISTYIALVRKWQIDEEVHDLKIELEKCIEDLTQFALQNPVGHGEALRALSYPDDAYRKVEVPLSWANSGEFRPFIGNFSARFALSYHERNDQKWQICTLSSCEIQGEGIGEFNKLFTTSENI